MIDKIEITCSTTPVRTPPKAQIETMFDKIAHQYDRLNHLLSFGIDKYWRKKGVNAIKDFKPKVILDVATGTGDLVITALACLNPEQIIAIDLSDEMLNIAEGKTKQWRNKIRLMKQDCASLSFENDCFDATMMAFGLRNFEQIDQSLQEVLRTLRPGGKLMILELSTPETFPIKQLYRLYSRLIIPAMGRVVAKNKQAYRYLPASVKAFPQGETLKLILENNGFKEVTYQKLTFGICTLYVGNKEIQKYHV